MVSDIEILAGPPAALYAATYGRSITSVERPSTEVMIDGVLWTVE